MPTFVEEQAVETTTPPAKPAAAKAKPAAQKPAAKPQKPAKKEVVEREIVYPEYAATLCVGDDALTFEQVKQFLGWTELDKEDKKTEYLFTDMNGVRVACLNNARNRPFAEEWAKALRQDQLNGNWEFNGESVIVGETGLILSAQHRFVGFGLAVQDWHKHPDKWRDVWPEEPRLPCLVVTGVKETSKVMRTLDNVKPRTLSDVLATEDVFTDAKKASDKKALIRMLSFAVSFLWSRTGMGANAFVPRQTHSEALNFLTRHKRLYDCVWHVFEEEGGSAKKISKYLSLGYAAALMYLMACSASDGDAYHGLELPDETAIDYRNFTKAENFWVLLAKDDPDFKNVRITKRDVAGYNSHIFAGGEGGGSQDERVGVLCKAWNAYVAGESITPGLLKLAYTVERADDGTVTSYKQLEFPTVGGIDLGKFKRQDEEEEELTPAQVEAAKEEVKEPSAAAKKAFEKLQALRNKADDTKAPGEPTVEKTVHDENGKPPAPTLKKPPVKAPVASAKATPAKPTAAPKPAAAPAKKPTPAPAAKAKPVKRK